jgi:hypothetical protein
MVDWKKVALFFSGFESLNAIGKAASALQLIKVVLPVWFITDTGTLVAICGVAALVHALIAIALFWYSQKKSKK